VGSENVDRVEITMDEFETIRLIDHMGLTQEECANQMNVARTTVQLIYNTTRKKLSIALVDGKRLHITGGAYELCPHSKQCCGRRCQNQDCTEKHCENGMRCCENCGNE